MIVKMIHSAKGAAEANGATIRVYEAGEEINSNEPWLANLMSSFISAGLAEEIKVVKPTEQKIETVEVEASEETAEATPKKRGRRRKGD